MLINLSAQELEIIEKALETDIGDMFNDFRDDTEGYRDTVYLLDRIAVAIKKANIMEATKTITVVGTELSTGNYKGIPDIDRLTREYENRED